MANTAGIVLIGNELLSGKVVEANAAYLCRQFRELGVEVRKISVIPDEVELIAREIREFQPAFTWVFTSGGVGPTHDDVTIEGVARGLGASVVRHPELVARLREVYQDRLNDARLKMAEIPDGAELLAMDSLVVPVLAIRNVFIFPGVPEIFRQKFEAIKEQFRESPFFLRTVFLCAQEDRIAHYLTAVLRSYPNLEIGSYPEAGQVDYQVKITMESKDQVYLDAAYQYLCTLLPAQFVVRSK